MKKLILVFSALIVAFGLTARASDLTGRVLDAETQNLIGDANVRIVETGKVVASDKHGIIHVQESPRQRISSLRDACRV